MSYIHDLAYYGGNANNQRYLESLNAAKAAATVTAVPLVPSAPLTKAQEIAAAQALLDSLNADSVAAAPVPPADAPVWKAKA